MNNSRKYQSNFTLVCSKKTFTQITLTYLMNIQSDTAFNISQKLLKTKIEFKYSR